MGVFPQWATPVRRAYLAQVALEYINRGDVLVNLETGELYHPEFSQRTESLIADWKAIDREKRREEWEVREREMHGVNERRWARGSLWDKEIYMGERPLYYVDGFGISADFQPVAKVRLASSNLRVFIDISQALKPLSKNKRRKALRYGKLSGDVQDCISKAVKAGLGL